MFHYFVTLNLFLEVIIIKYIHFSGNYITAKNEGHLKELVNFISQHYENITVLEGIAHTGNTVCLVPSNVSEGIAKINSKWLEECLLN